MTIEFCDLLSDDGWAPLVVDPGDPQMFWQAGGTLAGAPVDVAATLDGRRWRSTKVDPSFNAFGVRCAPGFTVPRCHHNLRHLVIVFGGAVTVEWGADGEEGAESFELGGFWVTDAGTPYTLTAGPDGVVFVESWSEPLDRIETHWYDHGWVREFDVIVVGGGTGLFGAYAAASRGLRTLVIESADTVGGTTAHSGAGIWLPGNPAIERAGIDDSAAIARPYLDAIIGDDAPAELREAYLDAGPRLIEELERNPRFQYFRWRGVPDYYPDEPGVFAQGRTVFPPKIPRRELGELEPLLRRPIWSERFGADPEEMLVGGQALIARALLALHETGCATVLTATALERLVVDDHGAVIGVEARSGAETLRFTARRGVLLAAGGYECNRDLREQHQSPITGEWTQGAPGNTGAALAAAVDVGAGTALLDEAWFAPGIVVPDGLPVFYTMVWSGIWVNAAGERFMNERLPYDRAGHEILAAHRASPVSHIPTYWVFDQRQVDNPRAFGQLPVEPQLDGWFDVEGWEAAGVLDRAVSLDALAALIGVPPESLVGSVDVFDQFARAGVDEAFHRGETPWDRLIVQVMGAHDDGPNPCLGVIGEPPFYAIRIVPTDLGTKGGITTDGRGRVMRTDGSVIAGLYAAGNTMAPMSGRVYPGAGVPVGSGMVFSYLAALDMAAK